MHRSEMFLSYKPFVPDKTLATLVFVLVRFSLVHSIIRQRINYLIDFCMYGVNGKLVTGNKRKCN